MYLSVLYDVDIEASACVLSSRYAMLCYAMLIRVYMGTGIFLHMLVIF